MEEVNEKPRKKPGRPAGVKLPPILKKTTKKAVKKAAKKTARPKPTRAELRARAEARAAAGRARRKYDWDAAREAFITSPNMSMKELSEKMNIPYDQMRIRASRERWTYQRAEEQKKIFKAKRTAHFQKMADESIKFDQVAIDTAKVGLGLVVGRLAEISRMFKAAQPAQAEVIAKMERGEAVTFAEMRSVINYKELSELARAAQAFQEIGRRAFGTDVQQFEFEGLDSGAVNAIENVINVGAELGKDDPGRLAAIIEAMERAGLITNLNLEDDVIDAEIVDERKEIGGGEVGANDVAGPGAVQEDAGAVQEDANRDQ